MLGLSKKEIDNKLDEIIAFADIGEFICQPVKIYSSGMFVRLAFAIAVSVDPEVLIVDEALSVGDIFFTIKCNAKIAEMQKRGITFVLVTHDMSSVRVLCSRAMLLERGEKKYYGEVLKAISFYTLDGKTIGGDAKTICFYDEKARDAINYKTTSFSPDFAVIQRFSIFDEKTRHPQIFEQKSNLIFICAFKLLRDLEVPYFHISLINSKNLVVYGKNSFQYEIQHRTVSRAGDVIEVRGSIELSVAADKYIFAVALHSVSQEILLLHRKDITNYLAEKRKIIISAKTEINVMPCPDGYHFSGIADLPDSWNCLWSE